MATQNCTEAQVSSVASIVNNPSVQHVMCLEKLSEKIAELQALMTVATFAEITEIDQDTVRIFQGVCDQFVGECRQMAVAARSGYMQMCRTGTKPRVEASNG